MSAVPGHGRVQPAVPAWAAELDQARINGRPLIRSVRPPIDVATAYEVRDAGIALRTARTSSPVMGYKVAFTSLAAQAAVGTAEPASGVLLGADIRRSGSVIAAHELFNPIVEVEIAFRPRRDISSRAPVEEILASCDVAAALELPDSRYQGWFGGRYPALTLYEVICDNCVSGLLVVSDRWLRADQVDLASAHAAITIDGVVTREGLGSNVLGHPAIPVEWLSGHLADRGQVLRAGSIISAGTLTETVPGTPALIQATFDPPFGEASVRILPTGDNR